MSFFYPSPDAPAIQEDLERARHEAKAFSTRYRGRIRQKGLAPHVLLSALKAYESIHEMAMRPYGYAILLQAADTGDYERNSLLERVRTDWYHIRKHIRFFESEIQGLDSVRLSGLADEPALAGYRHYLLRALSKRPHILPEDQERIIELKHLSGRNALVAMYDAIMGSRAFCVEVEGKTQSLGRDQVLSLLHHRDRDLRATRFFHHVEWFGCKMRSFFSTSSTPSPGTSNWRRRKGVTRTPWTGPAWQSEVDREVGGPSHGRDGSSLPACKAVFSGQGPGPGSRETSLHGSAGPASAGVTRAWAFERPGRGSLRPFKHSSLFSTIVPAPFLTRDASMRRSGRANRVVVSAAATGRGNRPTSSCTSPGRSGTSRRSPMSWATGSMAVWHRSKLM